ncbi:MAG TPA: 2-(1,2-epoxy-1,2-dihydrophenyl)acetyl-CoA isomerase PaaG [Roseiarcus sp.]|nr:2-(1,2-epoxy-1,2-dihydrophenyl)acetyl-CoA isomerase PaaG [Roseiarcus sp.]
MAAGAQVSSQSVLLDRLENGVLTLTLNRPERLNALNGALIEALSAGITRAGTDPGCRAVLITGAGRGFCAGADLANRAFAPGDARPDLGQALDKGLNPIIRGIRNLPKPVVCAVNGPAAGAGANIALACDIVLAAKSAQFLQAFARIGLIPDAGGTFVLPRLIGDARARALMMLAEPIGAERAEAMGMIYRAVDDEDLMGESHTVAERLAAGSTHALGLMKRALAASPTNSLDAQLDLERDLQREAGAGEDYMEGVRAFLDKRPANFGRKPSVT